MKYCIYLFFALCSGISTYAQSSLGQFLENGNVGTEYYLTFLPARSGAGEDDNIRIYVAATEWAEVTLEVKSNKYVVTKTVKPYVPTEFVLPAAIAQPYIKTDRSPSPEEAIYRQKAVHITASAPIIVSGIIRSMASSEGYLGMPVSALGTEYILTSSADAGDNGTGIGRYLPSEAGVVAAFDNTEVKFTLGGNSLTRTPGGMKPGETKVWTLNKGDVLSLASFGSGADLSGSKVVSSKPVSVISGNYCAYIPDKNTSFCNHLLEMEVPIHAWGKEYIVTKIFGRKKNPVLKIMAKEPNTKVYCNGEYIATIAEAGGVEERGYINFRKAENGEPTNFIVTSDKPINVTQYNPGEDDDGVASDPFQLVLTPVDHFIRSVVFATPGVGDTNSFDQNYVNIVFELGEDGGIPSGLTCHVLNSREFLSWKVIDKFGPSFERLPVSLHGKQYGVKTIALPIKGMYQFYCSYYFSRSSSPLAVYCYGFSESESYAYPAGASYADQSGGVDNLPPVPVSVQAENGDIDGVVSDSNAGWNSRLARVALRKASSDNYEFSSDEFIPGESSSTAWRARVIDKNKWASAEITFVDRAGNDTTVRYVYITPGKAVLETDSYNFASAPIGYRSKGRVVVKNRGNKNTVITTIDVPESDVFSVELPELPFTLTPGSVREVVVYFEPDIPDSVSTTIVFHAEDTTLTSVVSGTGRVSGFTVSSLDFSDVEVGSSKEMTIVLANTGIQPTLVTSVRLSTRANFAISHTPQLPLTIYNKEHHELTIRFTPPDTGMYSDEVIVFVDPGIEIRKTLSGRGVKSSTSVQDNSALSATMRAIYPNPAGEEALVEYTLAAPASVRLSLFNAMGEEVLGLTDGVQSAGKHTVRIPTGTLPSGMYMCRLMSGNTTVSGRVVIAH